MQPEANFKTAGEDNSYGLVRATWNKCLHIQCGGYCLSKKELIKGNFPSFLLCVLVPEIGASLKTSSGCPGTADPEITVPPKSNSCWGSLISSKDLCHTKWNLLEGISSYRLQLAPESGKNYFEVKVRLDEYIRDVWRTLNRTTQIIHTLACSDQVGGED